MAQVVLLQGGEAIPFPLTNGETILGRHPDCHIQLHSNMVSRMHARIVKSGHEHLLEDLESGNGTYVNGQRITGPTVLEHEDRIKLGPLLLRFEAHVSSGAAGRKSGGTAELFEMYSEGSMRGSATIMGTIDCAAGFGALDVRPEVKLKAVLDIARSLAGVADLESLLPKILDRLFEIFPHADRGCILLQDEDDGGMTPRACKHRYAQTDKPVKLSRTILNKVLTEKSGILSADAASDAQFATSESISNLSIRSVMCAPMLNLAGEPMGAISIDTQSLAKKFTRDDLDLLMAVAGQAALSYESARLLVTAMEKQRQDAEMKTARRVQAALLPAHLPKVPGYEFFASYDSAQAVGGDYYDCFRLDDHLMCLALGDVAGKGAPASLVMSRLSSAVQCMMPFVRDTSEAMGRINNHICSHAVDGRFVTFVLVLLDLKRNEISVANAGHMSPMIRRTDGAVEEFDGQSVGLPLGVSEDVAFKTIRRVLQPGETVVIYSDGISEAMNTSSELYGSERLSRLISDGPPEAEELGRSILEDVRRHMGDRPQNDDITLMAFGRKPDASNTP